MKILRMKLCYPEGDKIIIDKEKDLERFDLSKVSSIETEAQMTKEEFEKFWAEYK